MNKLSIFAGLFLLESLWATEPWDSKDFEAMRKKPLPQASFQYPEGEENWQRWSYPHQFKRTVEFIASMQVSDSGDPNYGGIIEGEDAMNIVETDNTQEAIWVISRYKEITGKTNYDDALDRAWVYVENHPAYHEEGTESDYYRVWNSGLALMAEREYRRVTGDSSFIPYADSCVEYIINHPLPFTGVPSFYKMLHPKVTAQAAGMLYRYALERNRPDWAEHAVSMGDSVKEWIEEDPETNLNDETWAMSGGTCVWGIANTVFEEDSSLGASWLEEYLPLMKTFQPGGDWSNSWNIWYAWAYRYSFDFTGDSSCLYIHHAIVDSLLIQDRDNDGGVPPTYGGPSTGDHSWVSSYMLFMGINELWDRLKETDAGIPGIVFPGPNHILRLGDTLDLRFLGANYGLLDLSAIPVHGEGLVSFDSIISINFTDVDTLFFGRAIVAEDTGVQTISISTALNNDERETNDQFRGEYYVYPIRVTEGRVWDSLAEKGVSAKIYFTLKGDSLPLDSVYTDPQTGEFTINLIDTIFYVKVSPSLPYPELFDTITISQSNVPFLDYKMAPAKILLVNTDPEEKYSEYLIPCLDSIGVSYVYWPRNTLGNFPFEKLFEFQDTVVLWMTGDANEYTITETEQESLTLFLERGGKLFVTGQNVAEDLAGTDFLSQILGVNFVSSPISSPFCYPIRSDSLGEDLDPFITVDGGSALNQTSRDEIAPAGSSHAFLSYDSLATSIAGVWKGNNAAKVVFLGFGLEGIGWTQAYPDFMNRKEVMAAILSSMGVTGIYEKRAKSYRINPKIVILINPVRDKLRFSLLSEKEIPEIQLFDVQGREVLSFETKYKGLKKSVFEFPIKLPSGVYFLRAKGIKSIKPVPFVIVR